MNTDQGVLIGFALVALALLLFIYWRGNLPLACLLLFLPLAVSAVPPVPRKMFRPADDRKGAQLLLSRTARAPAPASPDTAQPDLAISPSSSPGTFALTVNDTNRVLQFSEDLTNWTDCDWDPAVYSAPVGYDFRPEGRLFFRLKP